MSTQINLGALSNLTRHIHTSRTLRARASPKSHLCFHFIIIAVVYVGRRWQVFWRCYLWQTPSCEEYDLTLCIVWCVAVWVYASLACDNRTMEATCVILFARAHTRTYQHDHHNDTRHVHFCTCILIMPSGGPNQTKHVVFQWSQVLWRDIWKDFTDIFAEQSFELSLVWL